MSKAALPVEIEFSYDHPTAGSVTVEALYSVIEADHNSRESDVDYNGFQDLEYYAVFSGDEQVYVDIPDDVLYHNLRLKLRDAEISGCFSQEKGEF